MSRGEVARLAVSLTVAAVAGAVVGWAWIFTKPEPMPAKRPPLWLLDGTIAGD